MPSGRAGFSLPELLVAMTVASVLLVAAGVALQLGTESFVAGTDQAEAQQDVRLALERMIREIRGAGHGASYDPVAVPAYSFDAVVDHTGTRLTLQNDFDGDRLPNAPAGACDPMASSERVAYRLVGTELRRSTDPPAFGCEARIVADVQAFTLTYLDASDNVTAAPGSIRTVVVSVTIGSAGAKRPVTAVDRVRLRNRS